MSECKRCRRGFIGVVVVGGIVVFTHCQRGIVHGSVP